MAAISYNALLAEIDKLKSEITALKATAVAKPWQRSHYQCIYNHIMYYVPSVSIKYIGDFKFIDPSGNLLLNIENCIILHPKLSLEPSYINPKGVTIITDSTYCPNIHHIHTTLRRVIEMENVVKSLPTMNLSDTHPDFSKIITDRNIYQYPTCINIIFAIENISRHVRNILYRIYIGDIFENDYIKIMMEGLMYELIYGPFNSDTTISDTVKNDLIEIAKKERLDVIYFNCLSRMYGEYSSIFLEYSYPYSEIKETLYMPIKRKIGILYNGKLDMNHLAGK